MITEHTDSCQQHLPCSHTKPQISLLSRRNNRPVSLPTKQCLSTERGEIDKSENERKRAEMKETFFFLSSCRISHYSLSLHYWLDVILAAILELGSHLSIGGSTTFQLTDGIHSKHTRLLPRRACIETHSNTHSFVDKHRGTHSEQTYMMANERCWENNLTSLDLVPSCSISPQGSTIFETLFLTPRPGWIHSHLTVYVVCLSGI